MPGATAPAASAKAGASPDVLRRPRRPWALLGAVVGVVGVLALAAGLSGRGPGNAIAQGAAPVVTGPIYPAVGQAAGDLAAALRRAGAERKRVLVAFGGNWCPDCRMLETNLRRPESAALLQAHYVVVHVNVGDKGITDNLDLGSRFGMSLQKGVPALAVLAADGSVVVAQRNGEFESMRQLDPRTVTDFLQRWKG